MMLLLLWTMTITMPIACTPFDMLLEACHHKKWMKRGSPLLLLHKGKQEEELVIHRALFSFNEPLFCITGTIVHVKQLLVVIQRDIDTQESPTLYNRMASETSKEWL